MTWLISKWAKKLALNLRFMVIRNGQEKFLIFPFIPELGVNKPDIGDVKQGVTVSVEVVKGNKSLVSPNSALVTKDNKNYVWVYDKTNSKVLKKEVAVGNADAKSQEISSGLDKGQTIISNPDKNLKEGKKIEKPSSKANEKR